MVTRGESPYDSPDDAHCSAHGPYIERQRYGVLEGPCMDAKPRRYYQAPASNYGGTYDSGVQATECASKRTSPAVGESA